MSDCDCSKHGDDLKPLEEALALLLSHAQAVKETAIIRAVVFFMDPPD